MGRGANIPEVKLSIFYPGYQRFCSHAVGIFAVGVFSQYSKKTLGELNHMLNEGLKSAKSH